MLIAVAFDVTLWLAPRTDMCVYVCVQYSREEKGDKIDNNWRYDVVDNTYA